MTKEMSYNEWDLKCVLISNWGYFVDFYLRGVGGGLDETANRALTALRDNKILNEHMLVADNWREALAEVSKGRSIQELAKDDIRLVVEAWWRLEFRPKKKAHHSTTAIH
jgi:hypothetical protein